MMKDKKLIAFDMYRTCLDIKGEWDIFPFLSDELKIETSTLSKLFVTSQKTPSEIIKDLGGDESLCQIYEQKNLEVIGSMHPFPETVAVLQKLKKLGYAIAVVSNLNPEFIPPVEKFFPNHFDYNIYSCVEGVKKPHKEIFELLMQRSGYKADEIIMIGDSLKSDVGGARNAEIDGVLIDRSSEGIEQRDGYIKISSLDQIFELLN